MAVKTFSAGEQLTASDTNTYLANSGLVYINSVSVTNQAYARITSCFSNTYRDYRIVLDFYCIDTAARYGQLQLLTGSTVVATNYGSKCVIWNPTSGSATPDGYANSTTSHIIMAIGPNTNNPMVADVTVGRPYEAAYTVFTGTATGHLYGSYYAMGPHGGVHTQAVSYDGIQFSSTTGNCTGTMTVYGIRSA